MNALVGWLQSLGTLLEDAADGFMLMYTDGYLDGWFAFMATLALGIMIGWGLRSGIVYEHKEGTK
ncbi:MAG: hypothetical protein PHS57_06045 [Alphaproteobacteria bacterium]|nr:hypothetical protein [Alphaproteobacteria bacterium]